MARALERDANLRYQTASDFGTALLDAVATMPAAATLPAATLMVGATPPPTMRAAVAAGGAVSARAGGAERPARRRVPVLVGGGLAVAAAVIGAAVMLSPSSSRSRLAQTLPATRPHALPRTVAAGTATGTATDVSARLPDLLEQSTTQDKAASALAIARSLIPRAAHRGDLAGLALVRAQALGMLGKDGESCSVLAAARGGADGTPYAGRISQLLEDGCRPRRR